MDRRIQPKNAHGLQIHLPCLIKWQPEVGLGMRLAVVKWGTWICIYIYIIIYIYVYTYVYIHTVTYIYIADEGSASVNEPQSPYIYIYICVQEVVQYTIYSIDYIHYRVIF